MFVSDNLDVNKAGNLTIGGVDTVALAKKYGTPLYVMDEDLIRKHCRSFKQSMDKFYINLDEYGNTSSASIPIALSEMNQKGMIKPGMKLICVGFGGGLTWGGAYLEF